MLSTKKTIKTIGKSVELSGHIILLAAAVVGLFAIPLALAAADSKNKQESKIIMVTKQLVNLQL